MQIHSFCRLSFLLFLLIFIPFGASSEAALIDFDDFPGVDAQGEPFAPIAVIDDEFLQLGLTFGRTDISAGVGVLNLRGLDVSSAVSGLGADGLFPGGPGCCSGDIFFEFLGTTDLVAFDVGDDGGDLDVFSIQAFDLMDTLVFSLDVSGGSFSDIGRIEIVGVDVHRVVIDFDDENDFGFALDNLEFRRPSGVPEPAGLILLAFGLATLATVRC